MRLAGGGGGGRRWQAAAAGEGAHAAGELPLSWWRAAQHVTCTAQAAGLAHARLSHMGGAALPVRRLPAGPTCGAIRTLSSSVLRMNMACPSWA